MKWRPALCMVLGVQTQVGMHFVFYGTTFDWFIDLVVSHLTGSRLLITIVIHAVFLKEHAYLYDDTLISLLLIFCNITSICLLNGFVF